MRIIYFGSDDFGMPSLVELKKNHTIAAVVTAPDRPKGRGLKVAGTPVKDWALKNNIPVYQPESLREKDFPCTLKSLNPDFIVLISYGKILPLSILEIPCLAAVNVHPSLLPAYRGAAPMEWALINGEKETGITVISMLCETDTGCVIMQKKTEIGENEDIFSLKARLSGIAPGMLVESLEKIAKGFKPEPQKGVPSLARKLIKKDGLIKWEKTAAQIHNLIRGTKEWPGAYTYFNGRYLKIFDAEVISSSLAGEGQGEENRNKQMHGNPGEVVCADKNSIYASCGEGILKITEVQLEGKKRMPVQEFLKGHRIKPGESFSRRGL